MPDTNPTMPGDFTFTPEYDGTLSLKSAVYQALGAASVCWSEGPRGIFESERACQIAELLLEKIHEEMRLAATQESSAAARKYVEAVLARSELERQQDGLTW